MTHCKIEILVPVRFPDGKTVQGKLHDRTLDQIMKMSNGVTVAPGLYYGRWINPETSEVIFDTSRMLIVVIPDDEEKVKELSKYIRTKLCRRFKQKEIFFFVMRGNYVQ